MEKKSSINDIHKVIQKDLVELHKTLTTKLGQSNPFAKFSIGGGFYVWSDSRYPWRQMISASELEQSIVREELLDTKNRVAAQLGPKTAESLFTTPDDGYIYYHKEGNEIFILVTGWGFIKPARHVVTPDIDEIHVKNPVTVSFLYDGNPLAEYEFGLKLPKQLKSQFTTSEAVYGFDDLQVGEQQTLVDFETGQEFLLTVLAGQSHYDYDVTAYSHLNVFAAIGDSPISNETVRVTYHGKAYDIVTGPDGRASLELPFYDGEMISATLRDRTQNEVVNKAGSYVEFLFEKPKEIIETDVEVHVLVDGKPEEGADVTINYANESYLGKTSSEGIFSKHVVLNDSEICSVVVLGYETQARLLSNEKNVFRFDKESEKPQPDPDPVYFTPDILIEGDKGFIGRRYPIIVSYAGKDTEYKSNDEGVVQLPEMRSGERMRVTDVLNPNNIAEYELDSQQQVYVFHVPYEPLDIHRDIKVTILDAEGRPVQCDYVRFQQKDPSTDLLMGLDAEGSTYFGNESFVRGKDLEVSIIGGSKEYAPIVFILEEDENEYVLQERAKLTWWMILLQILAVLATIAGAILLWPLIQGFITGMFNFIYY